MTDRTIRASIREGASTLDAISAETGASTCCGGCEPTVNRILEEELGTPVIASAAEGSSLHARPLRPLRIVRNTEAA